MGGFWEMLKKKKNNVLNIRQTTVEIVEKNSQLASEGPERTQRPSGVIRPVG